MIDVYELRCHDLISVMCHVKTILLTVKWQYLFKWIMANDNDSTDDNVTDIRTILFLPLKNK